MHFLNSNIYYAFTPTVLRSISRKLFILAMMVQSGLPSMHLFNTYSCEPQEKKKQEKSILVYTKSNKQFLRHKYLSIRQKWCGCKEIAISFFFFPLWSQGPVLLADQLSKEEHSTHHPPQPSPTHLEIAIS